ncbi:MAG TPA: hypothetical protein VMM81_03020 [Acidimicrobiia bacterium]|nr:hypothetical protein [Acidimicrobiia bacterium]
MEIQARERWRKAVESWATPLHLFGVDEGTPFAVRLPLLADRTVDGDPTPTIAAVDHLSTGAGSVVDVSIGVERLVGDLARRGYRVTAVCSGLDEARRIGGVSRVTALVGEWPVIASNAGLHDVAVSTHAVFDTAAIGPFIEALSRTARRGVVIEATVKHPMAAFAKYITALHGHDLPKGPTLDDLVSAITEVTGTAPFVERWRAPAAPRFDDLTDLLLFYRRVLLITPEQSIEASGLLESAVEQADDGRFVLGPPERDLATIWWRG